MQCPMEGRALCQHTGLGAQQKPAGSYSKGLLRTLLSESYWYRHNFKIKVGFSTLLLLKEIPVFSMSLFPYHKFVYFITHI